MKALSLRLSDWVLAQSQNPLISFFARRVYGVSLKILTYDLGRTPGVIGVFLRRGMARGDWLPGASDLDLAVVLADDTPEGIEANVYFRLKRFSRWNPIPVDAEVFRAAELEVYLAFGNARAMEAPFTWRRLYGSVALAKRERTPSEISLHFYSEGLEQYFRLTKLWIAGGPTSRRLNRDVIKHYCDIVICCRTAVTGVISWPVSRLAGIEEVLRGTSEENLLNEILKCAGQAYRILPSDLGYALAGSALRHLHRAALGPRLGSLPPAWTATPIPKFTGLLGNGKTVFGITSARARAQGVDLTHLHFHQYMFLVVGSETVERGGNFMERVIPLLRHYHEFPGTLAVTEPVLRVLSSTFFYQKSAPHKRGRRVSAHGEMEDIESAKTEGVAVAEEAKRVCAFAYLSRQRHALG